MFAGLPSGRPCVVRPLTPVPRIARSHCHDCGHDCPRLTVDGLVGTSREYKAPSLIFLRMSTITVRRHDACQRILYGLEADVSRFPHDTLRYTTT